PGGQEEGAIRQAWCGRRGHHGLIVDGAVDVGEALVTVVAPGADEPPQVDGERTVWAGVGGVVAVARRRDLHRGMRRMDEAILRERSPSRSLTESQTFTTFALTQIKT